MKKAFIISAVCSLMLLFIAGSALSQVTSGCARAADEDTRLETARAVLLVNDRPDASQPDGLDIYHYTKVINYWAEDVIYKEPVLTNSGRQEMLNYLAAVFGGTPYGFPTDKVVTIKDELHQTHADGSMTYIATIQWSGTFGTQFFIQKGMSIIKFRPGEGCPYFHRDYFTEGDTWWNVPIWQPDIRTSRNTYIYLFQLTGRCFDEDGDGYTKYSPATGCPNAGLDCNDFVPEINPGAVEIPGNGIDDDCNPGTPD
jgi:Putative metal-binding motif